MTASDAFLAIDFETAATVRGSACAVGAVLFEEGEGQKVAYSLINPQIPESDWDPYSIFIHGIQPAEVRDSPSFVEVWEQLVALFPDVPLVAHNASFDMSVIRAEFARVGFEPSQPLSYTCSATLARKAWPDLVSVSLPIVCEFLEIELDHHHAASDAAACGELANQAATALGAESISEALEKVGRQWGEIRPDLSYSTGHVRGKWDSSNSLRAKDFKPDAGADFDEDHPLYGQIIVLTGEMETMTRREAFQAIASVGAVPGNSVTKKTNFLVVGDQDIRRLASGESVSSKHRKATEMRDAGHDIQIVGESDFLRLL